MKEELNNFEKAVKAKSQQEWREVEPLFREAIEGAIDRRKQDEFDRARLLLADYIEEKLQVERDNIIFLLEGYKIKNQPLCEQNVLIKIIQENFKNIWGAR